MVTKIKYFILLAVSGVFFFTACSKEQIEKYENEFGKEDAVMILESGYSSDIISTVEKPVDFNFNTKGIIEYVKDGNVIATFDYGDGTKDYWAILNKNGSNETIDLSASKKSSKYSKVITSPLIKINGCAYIVEGTIDYYKGNNWVATVNYGNGLCDNWATKTTKSGITTFSLIK